MEKPCDIKRVLHELEKDSSLTTREKRSSKSRKTCISRRVLMGCFLDNNQMEWNLIVIIVSGLEK
jgi:hypothetical protein